MVCSHHGAKTARRAAGVGSPAGPVGGDVGDVIKVGVLGARGKVGAEVCRAVEESADLALVAAVDAGDPIRALVDAGAARRSSTSPPGRGHGRPRVSASPTASTRVVGTTGFDDARLAALRGWLARRPATGVLIAPNFSIGAILDDALRRRPPRPFYESVGGRRAAPPDQGRRAVRHGPSYGGADRRGPPRGRRSARCPTRPRTGARGRPRRRRRRHPRCTGCGSAAWSRTRRSCSAAWGDPHHPARLARPGLVRARRARWACASSPTTRGSRSGSSTSWT